MVEFDPAFYVIAALVLLFVFFVFMFVRRTLAGFKEGVEDAKRER